MYSLVASSRIAGEYIQYVQAGWASLRFWKVKVYKGKLKVLVYAAR
jgi:hypothetical protein